MDKFEAGSPGEGLVRLDTFEGGSPDEGTLGGVKVGKSASNVHMDCTVSLVNTVPFGVTEGETVMVDVITAGWGGRMQESLG